MVKVKDGVFPTLDGHEDEEKCELCGKWVKEGRLWTILSPGPLGGKRVCFECKP